MFRVPTDPTRPSFDSTFKVGFLRWLTSSKADRSEWQRRRNAGAELAGEGQRARADAWAEQKQATIAADIERRKAERAQRA